MTVTATDQLRALLTLVREHEQGAREDRDPEHVHQLRVSVRRMRAIVRSDKELDGDLRWFGRSLGAVRDLDVQLGRLGAQLATFPPEDAAAGEPLLATLRAERTEARDRMLVVFDSPRYRQLLDALEAAKPKSVVDSSATATSKAYRPVRKAIDRLDKNSPDDELHDLRVKAKRLRYAAELTEGLGPMVKAAKDVQTLLGEHQDATVAESTVRRLLAATDDPATAFVAGRLVQAEHERKRWCRSRLWRTLKAVRKAASGHPELRASASP